MSLAKVRDAVRKASLGLTVGAGIAFAEEAYAKCIGGCKNGCSTCKTGCSSCNPQGSACKSTAKDVAIGGVYV